MLTSLHRRFPFSFIITLYFTVHALNLQSLFLFLPNNHCRCNNINCIPLILGLSATCCGWRPWKIMAWRRCFMLATTSWSFSCLLFCSCSSFSFHLLCPSAKKVCVLWVHCHFDSPLWVFFALFVCFSRQIFVHVFFFVCCSYG